MRKKIAIYANGWSMYNLQRMLTGMEKRLEEMDADVFVFLSHASYNGYDLLNRGELNIYELADMQDFDGVIIASNAVNDIDTVKMLCSRAAELKKPAISLGFDWAGVPYLDIDNYSGMHDLVVHLAEEHKVRRVVYIGGTKDHVDSVARLEITREVMASYGCEIAQKDIYYSDWGYLKAKIAIAEILASEEGLPDAIVCANDFNALAAITELTIAGYRVPEDVIVVGFDHVEEAKDFYPAITSVEQDYEEVGEACCRLLFDQMKNGVESVHIQTKSKFRVCESCGCSGYINFEERRHRYCQQAYVNSLRGDLLNQMEQSIETSIGNSVDYESLRENLCDHYRNNHLFEGDDFYIMLDSAYYANLLADENGLHREKYGDSIEVLFAMKKGSVYEAEKVDRHELIPGCGEETQRHLYFFLPIHVNQYNIGYTVVVDNPLLMQIGMLYPYVGRLRQALHELRANMRLDTLNKNLTALYNKDAMTGLYNRFGYENLAIPMFKKSIAKKESMVIFFVDINYMKKINDKHGHLQGDLAIQIVAGAIKSALRKDWIGIRYGGDEFLLIASDCDREKAEHVKNEINNNVVSESIHRELPFTLSVSIGYVVTDYTSDLLIQDYVKRADDVMYEIKRELHAKDVD